MEASATESSIVKTDYSVSLNQYDPVIVDLIKKEFIRQSEWNTGKSTQNNFRLSMFQKIGRSILSLNTKDIQYEIFGGFVRDMIGGYIPKDIDVYVYTENRFERKNMNDRKVIFDEKVNKLIKFLRELVPEITDIKKISVNEKSSYSRYKLELSLWTPTVKDMVIDIDLVMDSIRTDIDFDVNSLFSSTWSYFGHDEYGFSSEEIIENIKEKQFYYLCFSQQDDFLKKLKYDSNTRQKNRISSYLKIYLRIGKMLLRGWKLLNRNTLHKCSVFPGDKGYNLIECVNCKNNKDESFFGYLEMKCCGNHICFHCLRTKCQTDSKNEINCMGCSNLSHVDKNINQNKKKKKSNQ